MHDSYAHGYSPETLPALVLYMMSNSPSKIVCKYLDVVYGRKHTPPIIQLAYERQTASPWNSEAMRCCLYHGYFIPDGLSAVSEQLILCLYVFLALKYCYAFYGDINDYPIRVLC